MKTFLKTFILVLMLGGHSLIMWAFMTPGEQLMAAGMGGLFLGAGIALFYNIISISFAIEEVRR